MVFRPKGPRQQAVIEFYGPKVAERINGEGIGAKLETKEGQAADTTARQQKAAAKNQEQLVAREQKEGDNIIRRKGQGREGRKLGSKVKCQVGTGEGSTRPKQLDAQCEVGLEVAANKHTRSDTDATARRLKKIKAQLRAMPSKEERTEEQADR